MQIRAKLLAIFTLTFCSPSESLSGMSNQIKHKSMNSCSSIKRTSLMALIVNAFCSQNQASQTYAFS